MYIYIYIYIYIYVHIISIYYMYISISIYLPLYIYRVFHSGGHGGHLPILRFISKLPPPSKPMPPSMWRTNT